MKLPLPRRLAYGSLTLLLVVAVIELASAILYWSASGRWFSYANVASARRAAGQESLPSLPRPEIAEVGSEVIHPYVGYVHQPGPAPGPKEYPADALGFTTPTPLVEPPSKQRFHVLLTGGSVAAQLGFFAKTELVEELARSKAARGREVVLSTAATGGYKQPQALMAFAYAQSLGSRFDVVINLDGFNDIVLPAVECAPAGVALHYPRRWNLRTNGVLQTGALMNAGGYFAFQQMRRDFATSMQSSWTRGLVTANLVWFMGDRWLARRAYENWTGVEQAAARSPGFLRTGPAEKPTNEAEVMDQSTRIWIDSSVQMNALARGGGGVYIHFLQPNQYVKDSKPLTEEERRNAYDDRSGYGLIAIKGFPRLIGGAEELRRRGVEFHDLTRLFEDRRESLYVDTCCHLSPEGYRILARKMSSVVRARLDSDAY